MSYLRPINGFCIFLLVLCTLFLCSEVALAQTIESNKAKSWNETKSKLILRYLKYVKWPKEINPNPMNPLSFCLFRGDPLEEYIPLYASKEKMNYQIKIKKVGYKDSFTKCHVLFVNEDSIDNIDNVITNTKGRPILTMSDLPVFAKKGGITAIYVQNKKQATTLDVNTTSLKTSGLTIDTDLISVMNIYR